jgi:hypothetical protein
MKLQKPIFITLLFLLFGNFCFAQTKTTIVMPKNITVEEQVVKSSPAYAEVLLKRTELEADLEDLLIAYTMEFPKVKEIQFQLGLIKIEMNKLFAIKSSESQKLTLALGKLIVRKIELETELWNLKKKYSDDHPEVKKTKRKVLVFESAIKDVLL